MKLSFKIDTRTEIVEVPEDLVLKVLMPRNQPEDPDEEKILQEALAHPLGTKPLSQLVHAGEKVVLITSDNTRPFPSARVLPPVLAELERGGVRRQDIRILFARGSHRLMNEAEMKQAVGEEIYARYACANSSWDQVEHLGTTRAGTQVDLDARLAVADHVICLGNVEYHYFAGFSGGAKAVFPGCAVPASIEQNHRLMTLPNARAGHLEDNPVRQDLEEAASFVKADFMLNVVLNTKKQIVYAAAGDLKEAHRAACRQLAALYASPIPARADIVIVSQGGAPKDRNLYQTQKALDNAGHAVKKGGTVILAGSCREGYGHDAFQAYMEKYRDPSALVASIREHFVLGGHKAAAIALIQEEAEIDLVSDMPAAEVRKTFLTPYATIQEAYEAAQKKYGGRGTVIAMPYGGSTLPIVAE